MSWDDVQFDARGNLVDVTRPAEPGPPPDFTWTQLELVALTGEPILGRLVSVSDHRGVEHNLVVVSEVFTDDSGSWVRLVTHECFAAWGRLPQGTRPRTATPARAVPARHVWVMHEKPAFGVAGSPGRPRGG